VAGGSNDWIYGNFIGTDPTGTINEGNATGVWIASASNVTVGSKSDGHDALERNLISGNGGNDSAGILVDAAQSVTIQGNYLGTDATGAAVFTFTHNNDGNIKASNDSNLDIIGNVVSGGAYFGIDLYPNVNGVVIQGNRIGTNAAGTAALGGAGAAGIYLIQNIQNVTIGGQDTNAAGAPLAGAGNLISGNYNGITAFDCNGLTIQGNYVGTDLSGSYAIANLNDGVGVGQADTQNVTIGGVTAGAGNLISGNGRDGIAISPV